MHQRALFTGRRFRHALARIPTGFCSEGELLTGKDEGSSSSHVAEEGRGGGAGLAEALTDKHAGHRRQNCADSRGKRVFLGLPFGGGRGRPPHSLMCFQNFCLEIPMSPFRRLSRASTLGLRVSAGFLEKKVILTGLPRRCETREAWRNHRASSTRTRSRAQPGHPSSATLGRPRPCSSPTSAQPTGPQSLGSASRAWVFLAPTSS